MSISLRMLMYIREIQRYQNIQAMGLLYKLLKNRITVTAGLTWADAIISHLPLGEITVALERLYLLVNTWGWWILTKKLEKISMLPSPCTVSYQLHNLEHLLWNLVFSTLKWSLWYLTLLISEFGFVFFLHWLSPCMEMVSVHFIYEYLIAYSLLWSLTWEANCWSTSSKNMSLGYLKYRLT